MKHEEVPPQLKKGVLICLVAYLFFITASTTVWSFVQAFSTIQVIFLQNLISFCCIAPLCWRKSFPGLKTSLFSLHLARDTFGVLSYYLYFLAIRMLGLVDATILNYTAPFFVPLIWWVWMQEKVGKNVWWSIIIGFTGVAIILNPSKQIFQLGFLFGLLAGLFSGVAFCLIRVLGMKKEPSRRILFYYFLIGTIVSAPFAWVYWIPPTLLQWGKVLVVGICTAIGQLLLNTAYRYGTASYLSPLGYSTVIYAGLISYCFLGQALTLHTLLGSLLIVLGGTATYVLKKQPSSLADTFRIHKENDKAKR